MVEQQKRRLEGAISDMIEDMYRTHLRRMQSTMHRCAAGCCDDERGTLDSVQRCIEKCAMPLMDAQDYLQSELGQFQGNLQGCVRLEPESEPDSSLSCLATGAISTELKADTLSKLNIYSLNCFASQDTSHECNSDARGKMPNNPSEQDMNRSRHLFEVCTGNCVDKHINQLPDLMKAIKRTLDRGAPKRTYLRNQQNP